MIRVTTVAALSAVAAVTVTFAAASARAEPPPPELMQKLAVHAAKFERMRTHASYRVEGQLEQVDGDGKPSSVKRMKAHVEANGREALWQVDQYIEDGEDKTEEAREKELERRAARKKSGKKPLVMPTLASEQPNYTFDIVEVDRADPARVKITFVPKQLDERSVEGNAWVDTRSGNILSAGFKLSKTSMFVDFVHVRVRFGEETPLGLAVSTVEFEGKGGVLFLRKHFRGSATVSEYRVVP